MTEDTDGVDMREMRKRLDLRAVEITVAAWRQPRPRHAVCAANRVRIESRATCEGGRADNAVNVVAPSIARRSDMVFHAESAAIGWSGVISRNVAPKTLLAEELTAIALKGRSFVFQSAEPQHPVNQ
jgi:hypothetical protein